MGFSFGTSNLGQIGNMLVGANKNNPDDKGTQQSLAQYMNSIYGDANKDKNGNPKSLVGDGAFDSSNEYSQYANPQFWSGQGQSGNSLDTLGKASKLIGMLL